MSIFHDDIEGLKLAQNKHIDKAFNELKKIFYPKNIIEIGTCYGGFAVFLKHTFSDSNVYTFDPIEWGTPEYIKYKRNVFAANNITFYNEDCFLREGQKIKDLLKEKTLLLCDGAHKVNEFSFFSQFLQSGSVIMAHDYAKNREYFEKEILDKYWTTSFEFDGSQFDQWCIDKNLEPLLQDEFDRAVWFIRIKK